MVCEKRIFKVEAISDLLVPWSNNTILAQKPYIAIEKTGMYCTNYHKKNHNVETCRIKRTEKLFMQEVTIQ